MYRELIGPIIGGGLTTLVGFQAGTSVSDLPYITTRKESD